MHRKNIGARLFDLHHRGEQENYDCTGCLIKHDMMTHHQLLEQKIENYGTPTYF